MKVEIDGVQYVPMPDVPEDKSLLAALEVRFDSDAGDQITIRDYLHALLKTLWAEGEGFSGKRPFGNSGWEHDLFTPLGLAGFIECTITRWEDRADEVDMTKEQSAIAASYVFELIEAAFYGVKG